ncbi:uncharacterized protein Z518_03567 [Rhinocladiella mackenziei CBS 650.93]|uniref:FAD dependent oxidoreductase domain-containing protein n=1 Tax=Rhinocladiella mackenziei CBS 650.93 TaxID=1442369 RepID=A0A0D2JHU5_9EURO|nr:uncharacterized protein Z518_03567 [Rhinocladiella mackenziei CBS 650.93]KIX08910.1 hypothetical protein Z518_03567 [Rhinocladiella mackenziei CBS 650.93]
MAQKRIVIVGAGVAGLTTALLLSRNHRYKIVVAAKHMPGDYDIDVSVRGSKATKYEKDTWTPLEDLAWNHPEAGVHFQEECQIYSRTKDAGSATADWLNELLSSNAWFKDVVPNLSLLACLPSDFHHGLALMNCKLQFHQLPKAALGPGINAATSFTSVCINTAIYLPWLVSRCLENGVTFKRAVFQHITDAASPSFHQDQKTDLVVNCTGLNASKLGGVQDKSVVPARAQIVIVRNDAGKMIATSGTDDGDDDQSCRRGHHPGIMKRAVEMCPSLTGGKGIEHLDIIRHGVGLRPIREGGTRIEKERIQGIWVVHKHGAGGAGE